jgi:hypothetical protein
VPGLKKAVVLILLCCLLATLLSCGGSNSTLVFITSSTQTVVTGGFLQLTANVPVTWSVTTGNGAIDATGLFRAGNTAGTATVTAISKDGTGSSGTLVISITATGTTTTSGSSPTGISHRVFISNEFNGWLNIVNADSDVLSSHTITIGGAPTYILQTSDQTAEVIYDKTNNILALVDNSKETVEAATSSGAIGTGKISLAGTITSAAIIPGGTAVYAAVPTASLPSNPSVPGAVYRGDFTTSGFLSASVPGARFIALDHQGVDMLVFSQNSDTVTLVTSAAGTLISNTGTLTPQALPSVAANCTANCFSRPVAAVFSDDDTTAYVLSSGPANGGTQAMVTVLDMTQTLQTQALSSPPTLPAVKQTLNVSGANVGLLPDVGSLPGTQLYVAGAELTPCTGDPTQTCQQGVLTVINTSTNTITTTGLVGPDGPKVMPGVLTFDGTNLWIGSSGCQVSPGASGCLSLYMPSGSQVVTNTLPGVLSDQTDDVTGMVWLQPVNGRNIMYVIEGGALHIYDNSFDDLTSQIGLFISGTQVDAKAAK